MGKQRILYLSFALFFTAFSGALAVEGEPVMGKAASVNGIIISADEVNRHMLVFEQHILSTQGKALRPDMVPVLRNRILNGLIDKELLYQEARNQKVVVEEKAVRDRINALKGKYPSEETFQDEMRRMNLSEESLRSQIRKDLTIQQLLEKEILGKVSISDEDSKSFYDSHPEFFEEREKVRASHILIKSEVESDPVRKEEGKKKLEAIRKRIEKGEDFASLAKEFSQCPSAEKGGDLEYLERGKMVKPFEDAAFSLKPGELSDIVVTPFGFHLIKVTDRTAARKVPYEESKEKIKQHLGRIKFTEEKDAFVGNLKNKGKVEIY
ncbi:MAG: peptidylprolyl isomerase [Deltaproteobacteria bacterium]|nr:peptidylprolyl isomerase [Deltaproteobacteria bacterium]